MNIMIRDSREHYWKKTSDKEIYYYSLKDKYEIAFFDKALKILYINTRYKDHFTRSLCEIKRLYKNDGDVRYSEYFNITTKDLGWEE